MVRLFNRVGATNVVNAAPLINGKAVFVGSGFEVPITGDIDVANKVKL